MTTNTLAAPPQPEATSNRADCVQINYIKSMCSWQVALQHDTY